VFRGQTVDLQRHNVLPSFVSHLRSGYPCRWGPHRGATLGAKNLNEALTQQTKQWIGGPLCGLNPLSRHNHPTQLVTPVIHPPSKALSPSRNPIAQPVATCLGVENHRDEVSCMHYLQWRGCSTSWPGQPDNYSLGNLAGSQAETRYRGYACGNMPHGVLVSSCGRLFCSTHRDAQGEAQISVWVWVLGKMPRVGRPVASTIKIAQYSSPQATPSTRVRYCGLQQRRPWGESNDTTHGFRR